MADLLLRERRRALVAHGHARLSPTASRTTYGQVYDASTPNEQDHAFSGIMFDVRCREFLPVAAVWESEFLAHH